MASRAQRAAASSSPCNPGIPPTTAGEPRTAAWNFLTPLLRDVGPMTRARDLLCRIPDRTRRSADPRLHRRSLGTHPKGHTGLVEDAGWTNGSGGNHAPLCAAHDVRCLLARVSNCIGAFRL